MVWYVMVWYGMVWYGMVWYCMVRYNIDFNLVSEVKGSLSLIIVLNEAISRFTVNFAEIFLPEDPKVEITDCS